MVNPKKIYLIDNGIINAVTTKAEEKGWLYENLVGIELQRKGFEVFYYSDKYECDFIALDKINKEKIAIQVTLNSEEEREIKGLIEGMERISSKHGIIITQQEDKTLKIDEKTIRIIPLWKWLLE